MKKFFKENFAKILCTILALFVFCVLMVSCPQLMIGIVIGLLVYPELPKINAWIEKFAKSIGWKT